VPREKDPKSKIKDPKLEDFPDWLKIVSPWWTWDWAHQNYLYYHLGRITSGETKRLMIFMPPRHSKSETVTVRYSAWRLEREKNLNIILGSYNQKLANRFSRRIRTIASERMKLSTERRAADEWETTEGGGVRAVGVGAGVTGFGAGLIMIDDPVKNRAQAESQTYRDNTWDWFNDDIYTRLEPGGAIILTQTRWHDDDLAGRLIKEMEEGGEHWDVVSLPAIAEVSRGSRVMGREEERRTDESEPGTIVTGSTSMHSNAKRAGSARVHGAKPDRRSRIEDQGSVDVLGRLPGAALCPDRYDETELERIRKKIGAYSFAALYQQRPIPHDGALFKRKWFKQVIAKEPKGLKWARGYDLAVSTRTSADYTASFRCAMDDFGNLYIADGFRRQIEYPEQRRYVVERMIAEKKTEHGIEKALHGQAFVQDLRRMPEVRGAAFKAVKVDADKYTRALAWANLAEEGKVFLVRGAWIDDFLDEVCRFTGKGDAHDDQVDAVSLAVGMLRKKGRSAGF
jgi:predicted phage terminase large subunit-like protein